MSVTITLAGTPVPKGRPRFVMRGGHPHAYTPEATRAFEEALRLNARYQMRGHTIFTCRVAVDLVALFPTPRSWTKGDHAANAVGNRWPREDIDNLAKGALDALNGVVWVDDAQVVSMTASKAYGVPQLSVTVRAA